MSYYAYQDATPQAVTDIGAELIGSLIVTELDRQCPDARLRPFGRWTCAEWFTESELGKPISILRASVVWPEIARGSDFS